MLLFWSMMTFSPFSWWWSIQLLTPSFLSISSWETSESVLLTRWFSFFWEDFLGLLVGQVCRCYKNGLGRWCWHFVGRSPIAARCICDILKLGQRVTGQRTLVAVHTALWECFNSLKCWSTGAVHDLLLGQGNVSHSEFAMNKIWYGWFPSE